MTGNSRTCNPPSPECARTHSGDTTPWKEETPIPVITFLRDLVSTAKGPYHRLIGYNTRRFCGRAAQKAVSAEHKRAMFVVAAGADAFLAGLLGFATDKGRPSGTPIPEAKALTRQHTGQAMRIYASTALIVLGMEKDHLLGATGLDEAQWMHRWCFAFEYQAQDMRLFNEVLLPACQQQGFDGLTEVSAKAIGDALSCTESGAIPVDAEAVRNAVLHDVSAILNRNNEG